MENQTVPLDVNQPPSEPQLSSQLNPTTVPPTSTKLFGVLAVVGMILVGIGGYYLGLQQSQKTAQSPESQVQEQTKASPTANSTENWKVYTNSTFGFSVEYPESWAATGQLDSKEGWLSGTVVTIDSPQNTFQEGEPTIIGGFGISVLKTSHYSLKEQISSLGEGLGSPSRTEEKVTINGINGTMVGLPQTVGNLDRQVFLFERDNLIYSLSANWQTGNAAEKEKAQRILSTFKFVDQGEVSDAPSSVTTFSDSRFPLIFEYPKNLFVSSSFTNYVSLVGVNTQPFAFPDQADSRHAPIEMRIVDNFSNATAAAADFKQWLTPQSAKVEIIKGQGIEGTLVSGEIAEGYESNEQISKAFFKVDTKVVEIGYYNYVNPKLDKTTFLQILQSLKKK